MINSEEKIKILDEIIPKFESKIKNCSLCPRNCKVDRTKNKGYCNLDLELKIFCVNLHFGEEPVISGDKGSGTVFFSGCNLGCVYCQNDAFSHNGQGKIYSSHELAVEMIKLQDRGAKNINWVTVTPQLYSALKALKSAYEMGLKIPLVYNCGGYESLEAIQLLDGVVDVYLVPTCLTISFNTSLFFS